ncbi:MAG TPA: hypothetical protein VFC19_48015 [Candidatus Limnocylindrales bacterium]|nr:hypothetical protein [Candidatus Limnocylindrales bacterium]
MSTDTAQPAGGFHGDPLAALNPPAPAGGCCGGPTNAEATANAGAAQASTCCGTVAEAKTEGACCETAAKQEAVASGAGCCG